MEKTFRRSASVFCFTAFTLRYNLYYDNFILRVGTIPAIPNFFGSIFYYFGAVWWRFSCRGSCSFWNSQREYPRISDPDLDFVCSGFRCSFGHRLALFDRANPRPVYLAQSKGGNCANKCPLFPAMRMSNPRVEKSAPCELWHKFPLEIMGHRF